MRDHEQRNEPENQPRVIAPNRIREWMAPLVSTPLHPQWLVLRDRAQARSSIVTHAQGRVLDVGCGDRWAENALSPGCTYLGLDYPSTVELGYAGAPDVFGDGLQLPFSDQCFDSVLLLDVLEHLREAPKALSEAARVLKPGGTLILQVPFLYPLHDEPYDFQRWTSHGLRRAVEKHGVEIREITHHGNPAESAAALTAIALAKGLIDAAGQKHPSLLLAPVLVPLIPILNLAGWSLGRLLPRSSLMPLGYRVIGVRAP